MRMLFRTGFIVSAMALAVSLSAWAQAVTTFDDTYGGVSLSTNNVGVGCTVKSPVPAPLLISGGNAKTTQGDAAFQGTVNAQGVLQLHTSSGALMYGKVDASGAATAAVTLAGRGCTFSFAWKKR